VVQEPYGGRDACSRLGRADPVVSASRAHRRGRSLDPALARALAQGTYVVDARAVADAILRRPDAPCARRDPALHPRGGTV
jgi:hypothetical protein